MCQQVEVHRVEAERNEGNLLYLLHVYCDSLSRLLEKHGFRGFGKYVCLPHWFDSDRPNVHGQSLGLLAAFFTSG